MAAGEFAQSALDNLKRLGEEGRRKGKEGRGLSCIQDSCVQSWTKSLHPGLRSYISNSICWVAQGSQNRNSPNLWMRVFFSLMRRHSASALEGLFAACALCWLASTFLAAAIKRELTNFRSRERERVTEAELKVSRLENFKASNVNNASNANNDGDGHAWRENFLTQAMSIMQAMPMTMNLTHMYDWRLVNFPGEFEPYEQRNRHDSLAGRDGICWPSAASSVRRQYNDMSTEFPA